MKPAIAAILLLCGVAAISICRADFPDGKGGWLEYDEDDGIFVPRPSSFSKADTRNDADQPRNDEIERLKAENLTLKLKLDRNAPLSIEEKRTDLIKNGYEPVELRLVPDVAIPGLHTFAKRFKRQLMQANATPVEPKIVGGDPWCDGTYGDKDVQCGPED